MTRAGEVLSQEQLQSILIAYDKRIPLGEMLVHGGVITEDQQFDGDRQGIQEQIAEHALTMITRYLASAS